MDSIDSLQKIFLYPPTEFRSAPFWALNDKLSAEELERQIKDMKVHGIGGFFMHSREGLETEYMALEWMDCIKMAVKAASEVGMFAWIYDEDRWPSGAAGGIVPAKGGDAFRAKGLTIEILHGEFIDNGNVLAVFTGKIEGDFISCCKRVDKNDIYEPGLDEILLVFRREVSFPSEWFNDDAPSDNMNPECVKAFIESTYEAYKKEIGCEFGKTIPGVFTDEPNVAHRYCKFTGNRGWIPWTDGFKEYFMQKRGYDILDIIPYMFFEGEKSEKIRHDYWRTVSERFSEVYSGQIGEWCEENGLSFTGHFLFENDMGAAVKVSGSIMPHYVYQHIPGIDMLTEQTLENLTVKQCTSVANQFGRKRVLSETYACTGWDFDFEGQKWIGDWQFVMGVNLRCQHLALYSLKGCRKRDFPPAFSYNTSWWKYNNVVEDYFARISAVMSQGKPIRDILVIHPVSTAWSMMGSEVESPGLWNPDKYTRMVNKYGEEFNDFLRYMLGIHYDFDLGDEIIMESNGYIKEKKLYINQIGYSVVIIPPVTTLFSNTVSLLIEFMNEGGTVIAMEPLASMVEGQADADISALFTHKNMIIAKSRANILEKLEKVLPRKISIKDKNGIEVQAVLHMLKEDLDFYSLFIVNNDRKQSHDLRISLDINGNLEEWDLLTGKTGCPEINKGINGINFRVKLGPAGSKLYVINKKTNDMEEKASGKAAVDFSDSSVDILASFGPVCEFSRTVENVLVLDKCLYRIENDNWSEEVDVWQAQRAVRDKLGMRQVYYNGLPQRYKWVSEPHPKDCTGTEFKFYFNVAAIPEKEVFLVLEAASNFSIELNGNIIANSPVGWFMDRTFDKIKLKGLKQGQNELVLSCAYTNAMEAEDCYIIGDFGVDVERNITKEAPIIHFGDWCLQGYFHYCGSIVYHLDFNYSDDTAGKVFLELGSYSAVTVEVRVNGKTAGHIPWKAANRVELTGSLVKGKNLIDIEVMGSPRNIFGPLHQTDDKNPWTDWRSFRREDRQYTPNYIVKPYGLFGQVNIYSVKYFE